MRASIATRLMQCLACTGLLTLAGTGGAAQPAQDIDLSQFGIQRWDVEDGLGSNWVRGVVEDPDGTIWIGTGIGLVRFDGSRFTPVLGGGLGELPQRTITSIARGGDGAIWVGLEYGGVRRVPVDSARAVPQLPDGVVVRDLLVDGAGALWIATSEGLWRSDARGLSAIAPEAAAPRAEVMSLAQGPQAEVWVRTTEHGLWRVVDGEAEPSVDAPGCRGYGIAVGPDGERFMSCREGIWRSPAGGGAWQRIADDFAVGPIHLDRRGDLWFGASSGLTRWSRGRLERLPAAQGLGDWRVRALAEDRRGDLWIGSFSAGLARLHRGPVQSYGAPEGLPIDGPTAVQVDAQGRLLIGALRKGLLRYEPETRRLEQWNQESGLPGETAWALATDPRWPDGIWVGADRGLAWFADGRLHDRGPGGEAYAGVVRVLYADPVAPGTLWLSGESSGAVALHGNAIERHGVERGLPLVRARFFHRDRAGRLLAGGEQGLYAWGDGRWTEIAPGGQRLDGLTAMAQADDGALWLASSRVGLLRVDGLRALAWGPDSGLPFWPIHSLAFDAIGGLWMSGNEGLARIRLDDHARWAAGTLSKVPVERLGRRDGLRDVETNGWGYPAHTVLADGRLVYPSALGIARVDPTALPSVGLSPQEIQLRGAWTGTRPLSVEAPLHLGREERTLRIAFSAIELLRPETVTFRYRLQGVDPDWIEAGTTREAGWSLLPPGEHALRLQARLPGQPWIDAAAATPVEVQPQPWESPALRLAALAALLSLATLAVHWRLRIGSRHAAVLQRARAFLREVIDTSPNPIFARDRNGAYVLANRAAAAVYRLEPGALEGRGPAELGPPPPGMAQVDSLDAEVVASGAERVLPEHGIVDADGRQRWFRVVKRPGFGADGRSVEQVIGTAVDVTDYKLAEQGLRREKRRLQRSRAKARTLSWQLLRAQEDERRRLAREIHDDLTQQLAGLSMLAWSTAQAAAREPGVDRREALEHLARGLERLANDVQALSRELHPPALESLGLAEALRAECATFGTRTGLAISFQAGALAAEPPPEVGLALYRIAQEALRNVLVHARAERIVVRVERREDAVRMEVSDDGVGFEPGAPGARIGIGLGGMRERARLAGATIEIESARGRGTRIVVEWRERARRQSGLPVDP